MTFSYEYFIQLWASALICHQNIFHICSKFAVRQNHQSGIFLYFNDRTKQRVIWIEVHVVQSEMVLRIKYNVISWDRVCSTLKMKALSTNKSKSHQHNKEALRFIVFYEKFLYPWIECAIHNNCGNRIEDDDIHIILYEYVETFRTPIDSKAIFNTLEIFECVVG